MRLASESLQAGAAGPPLRRRDALLQCSAFTFLNPHVYLDTVVLIGSVGAQQSRAGTLPFFLGCAAASAVWFFGLGYGARLLAPLFARPYAWRVLDGLVGATMFALAWTIGAGAVRGA